MQDIVEASVVRDYRIRIRFEDGVEGEVDLARLVGQGVFEAWRDPAVFGQMYVDAEAGTVAWPCDIDLAPDALYDYVARGRPLPSDSVEESGR